MVFLYKSLEEKNIYISVTLIVREMLLEGLKGMFALSQEPLGF